MMFLLLKPDFYEPTTMKITSTKIPTLDCSREEVKTDSPAVLALIALVKKQHPEHTDLDVSVFLAGEARISELSASWKTPTGEAGFAFMACELECFALLFAAERFLLNYGVAPYRPGGWESDIDIAAEAEEDFVALYGGE